MESTCDGAPKCFLDDVFVVDVDDDDDPDEADRQKATGNCYPMSGQCSGTPVWSPDRKRIAFSRRPGRLWTGDRPQAEAWPGSGPGPCPARLGAGRRRAARRPGDPVVGAVGVPHADRAAERPFGAWLEAGDAAMDRAGVTEPPHGCANVGRLCVCGEQGSRPGAGWRARRLPLSLSSPGAQRTTALNRRDPHSEYKAAHVTSWPGQMISSARGSTRMTMLWASSAESSS
jgi:hypothetical protein